MEDDLLSLVPFKLEMIIIGDDFKDIRKGLTPTIIPTEMDFSAKD